MTIGGYLKVWPCEMRGNRAAAASGWYPDAGVEAAEFLLSLVSSGFDALVVNPETWVGAWYALRRVHPWLSRCGDQDNFQVLDKKFSFELMPFFWKQRIISKSKISGSEGFLR